MHIYTGPMRLVRLTRSLDITVKSGDQVFAPSWDIVMGLKRNEISWEDYKHKYQLMMKHSQQINRERWLEIIQQEDVLLVCYCPKPDQCHRSLLAEMLVTFAEENGQVAINHGEIGKPWR